MGGLTLGGGFNFLGGGGGVAVQEHCHTHVMHSRMWVSTVKNTTELGRVCDT